MLKCVNDQCSYFKEYGECSSACEAQGIKKIVTNYDRIQAMSVEEVAKSRIFYRDDWGDYVTDNGQYYDEEEEAIKAEIAWLESEVSE